MQGKAHVRLGKAREQAVGHMALAPPSPSSAGWPTNISVPLHWLFMSSSGLAAPTQAAMWMSWPQQCATGVSALRHICLARAGVGQAGFLLHRQGIELGAHHHRGPRAVPVDGDDAGLANAFGHLEAQRPHLLGEPGRRPRLLEAELGMLWMSL